MGPPFSERRGGTRAARVQGPGDRVAYRDHVEEHACEDEKGRGPEALMQHEELGGGGLEGFQAVRRDEDVERRGERKGDPRRQQGGEHEEEPYGQPELETPVHHPFAATILDRAQIRLPFPFFAILIVVSAESMRIPPPWAC